MSQTLATSAPGSNRWAQYYALTKPRVVQLIVFCALIGMLLAEPGWPDWALVVPASAGIWLVAAAAAATPRAATPSPVGRRRLFSLTS